MKSKEYTDCILMITSMIVLFGIMIFNIFIFLNNFIWLNILLYSVIGLLITLNICGFVMRKDVYLKLTLVASVVLLIIYLIYFALVKTNILQQIKINVNEF